MQAFTPFGSCQYVHVLLCSCLSAVGMVPDCSNASLITIPDTVPYSLSSARIRRRPNPFLVRNTGECNAACLLEPFCLFYVVADTTANRTHCNLYSSVVGSGLTSFRGGAFGTVARCPFVPGMCQPSACNVQECASQHDISAWRCNA